MFGAIQYEYPLNKQEVTNMCKTCRTHHPELYVDKPAPQPEKKAPAKKK